jgi:hypothetical protein
MGLAAHEGDDVVAYELVAKSGQGRQSGVRGAPPGLGRYTGCIERLCGGSLMIIE